MLPFHAVPQPTGLSFIQGQTIAVDFVINDTITRQELLTVGPGSFTANINNLLGDFEIFGNNGEFRFRYIGSDPTVNKVEVIESTQVATRDFYEMFGYDTGNDRIVTADSVVQGFDPNLSTGSSINLSLIHI